MSNESLRAGSAPGTCALSTKSAPGLGMLKPVSCAAPLTTLCTLGLPVPTTVTVTFRLIWVWISPQASCTSIRTGGVDRLVRLCVVRLCIEHDPELGTVGARVEAHGTAGRDHTQDVNGILRLGPSRQRAAARPFASVRVSKGRTWPWPEST